MPVDLRLLERGDSDPHADPEAPGGGRLDPPATLAEIKQSKEFEDWALVRQSRLSTMAAPDKFIKWMKMRYPKAKL